MKKTPEEIKYGLHCLWTDCSCKDCGYDRKGCVERVDKDALAYIEQLEAENNALKQAARDVKKHIENAKRATERIGERLSELKQSGAGTNVPRWISVEDEMPEDDVEVLVCAVGDDESSIIAMTSYTHHMYGYNIEGWRSPWQYFFDNYKITHWMPLPEAPKEG